MIGFQIALSGIVVFITCRIHLKAYGFIRVWQQKIGAIGLLSSIIGLLIQIWS